MECKIVVGTKSGKSYNLEAKDDLAAVFIGKRIGDVVNLTPLGLKGYEAKITGGSDKCGFPMRKDMHLIGRSKAMMSRRTTGYRPEDFSNGVRMRKTVVGDIINDAVAQLNVVVVKDGHDPIPKLLGIADKPAEGAKAEEKTAEAPKAEAPKEHKPAEHKAEAPKEHKPAEHKAEAREGREATLRTGSPEANLVPKG
jgi:small subunit ribosomal protein S6e